MYSFKNHCKFALDLIKIEKEIVVSWNSTQCQQQACILDLITLTNCSKTNWTMRQFPCL